MSKSLEQMTAAGGTVVIGGVTYLTSQLTLGDYGQIQAWLRQRAPKPFAVVAEALKDLEPIRLIDPEGYAEARKLLLMAAMEDSKRSEGSGASPEVVAECLNGPEGIAMLLWLCCRKHQPAVTFETIRAGIHAENLSGLKKHLDSINLFNNEEDEEAGPFANPTTPPATATT
jgi:hypothetical protein